MRRIRDADHVDDDDDDNDNDNNIIIKDKRSLGRRNNIVFSTWKREDIIIFWEKHMNNVECTSNQQEPFAFSQCNIWQGSKQNGYPCISQGHGKSKIKMHIVSAWIQNEKFPQENEVVSHLCHRKLCISSNHLVIETIAKNNARKGCLGAFKDNKGNVWCLCPHIPRCLRSDTDNNNNFKPFPLELEVDVSSSQ